MTAEQMTTDLTDEQVDVKVADAETLLKWLAKRFTEIALHCGPFAGSKIWYVNASNYRAKPLVVQASTPLAALRKLARIVEENA